MEMKMKLTEWFPGNIKPVREGVYMLMSGTRELVGYQYWNGEKWGAWCATPQGAKKHKNMLASSYFQNDQWRGVLK